MSTALELYSDVWQALPLPLVVLDGSHHIREVNPAFEDLASLSNRALTGRDIWSIIEADPALAQRLHALHNTHSPLVMRMRTIQINGRSMPANLRLSLIERPAAEDTCARECDTIMIVEPTSRLTAKPLQAARSAIGMADMLAHEIKNPLAGIKGAAQLLHMELSEKLPEASRDLTDLTDLIVSETRRIVDLVEYVGQFGQQKAPEPVAFNLHDMLERARRSSELGGARHMIFTENYDPSLPLALADPDQIQQVVLNLLQNAAQASPDGGKITLRTFYDAGLRRQIGGRDVVLPLHIEIADNGPGMPPEIAEQAFDPFVSGREAGTGLGLALASQLMLSNDGWIEIKSPPQGGAARTTVRLSLRRA